MNNSICRDCMNREICSESNRLECEHYDIAFTRSEVYNILDNAKIKDPNFVPHILGAIKKTYKINLSYQ